MLVKLGIISPGRGEKKYLKPPPTRFSGVFSPTYKFLDIFLELSAGCMAAVGKKKWKEEQLCLTSFFLKAQTKT